MKNLFCRGVSGLLTLVMSLALTFCISNDATAANTEQTATNLLTNGDFEARSVVPGWDIGKGTGVNLAHGDARTGELALRIVDGGTDNYTVTSDSVLVTAGRSYTVSVYAKGAAGAQITLKFFNEDADVVGTASATLNADATDWTLLSASATAPADAKIANVYLSTTASCTGTVLFDDALLEQSTAPVSIVVNGNFENGTTGWIKDYGGTVSTVNKSDTDSTKVLKVDSVMGSYTTLSQKKLSATAGETYIVSYDYKLNLTQRKSNTIMVRLQFRNSTGELLGNQQDFYGDKVEVQDWKQFTGETTAPEGTATVDVTLV